MVAAYLTTICWAFSVVFATRSARLLGGALANISRMVLALVLLGAWAHLFGKGLQGPSLKWFILSGVIGFGLGDIALFLALPRIGPRLTILLAQTLAAPIGAMVEWLWLGTSLSQTELLCSGVALAGIAVALAPSKGSSAPHPHAISGVCFGVLAGAGQAIGAVCSRKANGIAGLAGMHIDGGTAAYQRMIGGLLFAAALFVLMKRLDHQVPAEPLAHRWRKAWKPLAGNAISGPVLGVACYQWALASAPSGVVLAVVATSPVATMILTAWLEGDRPKRRAIAGGLLAVAGAMGLALARHALK